MDSIRDQRAKIVIVDEALEMNQDKLDSIVEPTKNFRRDICNFYHFRDFNSKTVSITSACNKNNSFYDDFLRVVRLCAKGDKEAFACALDYRTAIMEGTTDAEFFDAQRASMPQQRFNEEYGSIFQGAVANSAFPYE